MEALAQWARAFEVPDIVDYQDHLAFAPQFAAELHRRGQPDPDQFSMFPYPKDTGGVRWLGLCGLRDLVLMRTAAGEVARTTEQVLLDRVHSSRLVRNPPAWRFRRGKKAHERFRSAVLSHLQGDPRRPVLPMCVIDVRNYYESVPYELLESELLALNCPGDCVAMLLGVLRRWASRDGLRGLPVGPEFAAVMGNAYLFKVDEALHREGIDFERYMDDLVTFGAGRRGEEVLYLLDHQLMELQLLRSLPKTKLYENWFEAIDAVEDDLLVSLGWLAGRDVDRTRQAVRRAFDDHAWAPDGQVRPKRLKWILSYLRNRHDPYAALRLAGDVELMNLEPAGAGAYLGKVGLNDSRVVEGIMDALEADPSDRTDALDLHLLKALQKKPWGRAEGRLFLRTAQGGRRSPIRAWASLASQRTPEWLRDDAVDQALEATDPLVQRAWIVSIARDAPGPGRRAALTHLRSRLPGMHFTTAWALAA